MIRFVGSGVNSLQLFLVDRISPITLLTEIEIKAVVALVSHVLDGHLLTPITLHVLFNSLSRLNNKLNFVFLCVASHLQILIRSGEVTVLAKAEMIAIGADKTSTDDWSHVATHTLVLVMSSQAISQ